MKKAKIPTHGSSATIITPKKIKKSIVQTNEYGLGLLFNHEPPVFLKTGQIVREKFSIHLVNENMEPKMMGRGENRKAKIVLMSKSNFKILELPKKSAFVRQEDGSLKDETSGTVLRQGDPLWIEANERVTALEMRASKKSGVPSAKDFSKYKFNGAVLGKGRLVLEIVRKFVADNNPTMAELRSAFPIRAYKGMFVTAVEAVQINEADNKRSRFFASKEDILKLKGNVKISVTNQITAEIAERVIKVATETHGMSIKMSN